MKIPQSTHDATYWARVTKGLDFSDADGVDPLLYNRILWRGMMHNLPYPPSLSLRDKRACDEDDNAATLPTKGLRERQQHYRTINGQNK